MLVEGKSSCLKQVVGVAFGIVSLTIPPLILLENNDWSEALKFGFNDSDVFASIRTRRQHIHEGAMIR